MEPNIVLQIQRPYEALPEVVQVRVAGFGQTLHMVPRARIGELRTAFDGPSPFDHDGLYVLYGHHLRSGALEVYIGQSGASAGRLPSHQHRRFWTHAAILEIPNIDSDVRTVVEHRLIQVAERHSHVRLQNRQKETSRSARVERGHRHTVQTAVVYSLEMLRAVDCALDRSAFAPEAPDVDVAGLAPIGPLHYRRRGADATGYSLGRRFQVSAGSFAAPTVVPSLAGTRFERRREELRRRGLLVPRGDVLVFTEPVIFSSSSAAVKAVSGMSESGPKNWRDEDGARLKDLQN